MSTAALPAARPGGRHAAPARRPRRDLAVVGVVPALTALLLGAWATGRPSYWTDELVTVDVARRSVAQIWQLLGNVDAVHGLYYLLMHPLVGLAGTAPGVVRLPSVLATAVAAGALGCLGRYLAGNAAGLLAGTAYALTPVASQYALEARSYALVAATAVLATFALAAALRTGRAVWFAAYGVLLALTGALHLFAVLLVTAHAVTVLLSVLLRHLSLRQALAWLAAVTAALLALAPLALVAAGERGAVEWIRPPDAGHLWASVVGVTGSVAATLLTAVLCAAGVVAHRLRSLVLVAVPWAVVPPLALLALSRAEPLFVARYVLFCVPAVALLVAAGLTARPRALTAMAGAALLLATLAAQPALRRPDSKWHDFTPVVAALCERAEPGDRYLVAPANARLLAAAYPRVFTGLVDVAQQVPGARGGTLAGTETGRRELARRLRSADRVWLIRRLNGNARVRDATRRRIALLAEAGLTREAGRWKGERTRLTLYVRGPSLSGVLPASSRPDVTKAGGGASLPV
ncbi:glycosyltransferase family 39 protein [Spirillospora sp. NPDC047279]|uniref:glycosyltransferase family 39 protein n=1 Tax=Spirillospora sp. NPDC047279 TaxID=3155478 RepID=UPI0033E7EE42